MCSTLPSKFLFFTCRFPVNRYNIVINFERAFFHYTDELFESFYQWEFSIGVWNKRNGHMAPGSCGEKLIIDLKGMI